VADEEKVLFQCVKELLKADDKSAITELLTDKRSSDIAEIVEMLNNQQRRIIFSTLSTSTLAEVLEKVDEATRGELFEEVLQEKELTSLVSYLDNDDAADILLELPDEMSTKILETITPDQSARIKELMAYDEDSAGGIMDPSLISVFDNTTIAEAIDKIRAADADEDFFFIYVVDKVGRFLGDVRIRLLMTSPQNTKIDELINNDAIYVYDHIDQEEVRNIFKKNDLMVLPVLDKNHNLIGRITADRVIEVAEEEAAEDMYAMAGTDPDELDNVSILRAARIRMTWLLPCLIGTGITAFVLMFFQGKFTSTIYAAIVIFVPMIAAISGNAGLQTSAIVVCGLATGDMAAKNLRKVFTREVRIAILVAISCGIIGALICGILPQLKTAGIGTQQLSQLSNIDFGEHTRIVMAFGTGMFSAIMVATTLGLLLPFLFHHIGIDPAVSSGPLVTTANDSISVAIYMVLTLLLI
jgi:magnesium transporter